jgi:hypothetical protein
MSEFVANPIEVEFEQKICSAVKVALDAIEAHRNSGGLFMDEFDWLELQYWQNGMPWFTKSNSAPPNYASPFYWVPPDSGMSEANDGRAVDPTDASPEFALLERLITENDFLRERILPAGKWDPGADGTLPKIVTFSARYAARKIASRYVHLYHSTRFDATQFKAVFDSYKRGVFAEKLPVDICIPILFVRFSFDEVRIDEKIKISRMDDEFQLARGSQRSYGVGSHELVMGCATHMLVLESWEVSNGNHFNLFQRFASRDYYPLDHIDRFFAALRATSAIPTGYCQLLLRPVGWADQWKAGLPTYLYGATTRAYPGVFEDFYWTRPTLPELSVSDAATCGSAFRRLLEATENSLSIGVRRLNLCYCRDDEEDSLIDATIALEALLSDGEHQEMTHKLALRVAAVSQLYPGQLKSGQQIFDEVKKVYTARSRIIHGKTRKIPGSRAMSATRTPISDAPEIAREHLRTVLRVLVEYPQYRKPRAIDELLLRAIGSRVAQS